jgi:hypothetical protein
MRNKAFSAKIINADQGEAVFSIFVLGDYYLGKYVNAKNVEFDNLDDFDDPLIVNIEIEKEKLDIQDTIPLPFAPDWFDFKGWENGPGTKETRIRDIQLPVRVEDTSIIRIKNYKKPSKMSEINLDYDFASFTTKISQDGEDTIIKTVFLQKTRHIPVSKYQDVLKLQSEIFNWYKNVLAN